MVKGDGEEETKIEVEMKGLSQEEMEKYMQIPLEEKLPKNGNAGIIGLA